MVVDLVVYGTMQLFRMEVKFIVIGCLILLLRIEYTAYVAAYTLLMYGINLHKSTHSTWVRDGFNLWINGSASIYKHSMSDNHITSSIKFKISTRCIPIIPSLQSERKMQVKLNREVVAELIDIVIFLARHNLAFRGHRESWSMATSTSKGNFKDLVILIAKYSAVMSEHITKI